MKNKFTKLVSLFMSAVMTVSALSLSGFSSFAETGDSPEQTVDTQDTDVSYGGIFGSMFADEIDDNVKSKQKAANADYAVHKIYHDHDTSLVGVEYHAKADCTLVIGFYNDEGTELITSVTKDLEASDDGYIETYTLDTLPDHYLIKAFLVGREFRDPLSSPCVYNKFTLQMQEILSKTVDDYDDSKVINLDTNSDNNFLVTKEKYINIESSENADTFLGCEDKTYKFDNIDKVKSLKKDDLVALYTEEGLDFFKVDSIKIEGSAATIVAADMKAEEAFDLIKIDSDDFEGKTGAKVVNKNDDIIEKVTFASDTAAPVSPAPAPKVNQDGSLTLPHIDSQYKFEKEYSKSVSDSVTFSFLEQELLEKGSDKKKLKVTGHSQLTIGVDIDFEFYASYDLKLGEKDEFFASFDLDQTLTKSFEFNGEISGEFSLGDVMIPVLSPALAKILRIEVEPKLFVTLSGEVSFATSKTTNTHWDSDCGEIKSDKPTSFTSSSVSADLEISIGVEIRIVVFSEDILSIGVTPKFGASIGVETTSDNNPYLRHDCEWCFGGNISYFFDIDVSAEIIKKWTDKLSFTVTFEVAASEPVPFYINKTGFHFGTCENISHKIRVTVIDAERKLPIEGATLFDSCGAKKPYSEITRADNGTPLKTQSNGSIEFFVPEVYLTDSKYMIFAEAENNNTGTVKVGSKWDEHRRRIQEFTVKIYIDNEEKEEKEKDPEETADKPLGPRTYVFGYARDENGNNIKDQNGNDIPTVFCTVYPDENSTDPSHPYQEVGYVYGKGAIDIGSFGVPGVKKIMVVDPETTLDKDCAFGGSPYESVDLSAMTVESIPYGTFNNCKNLKEVILPPTISKIGNRAFAGCTNLEHIDLPEGVILIDEYAFADSGLTKFTCPPALMAISNNAFLYCTDLREVTLNLGLGYIGDTAFQGTSIQIINIPESASEISNAPFADCDNLRTVIFNRDVVQIDEFEVDEKGKFSYNIVRDNSDRILCLARNLRQAIFNEGVTKINARLFVSNKNLTSVSLPRTLKTIEDYAFYGTNLSNVKLPEGLESIGDYAFASTNLVNVTIPNSVTVIGKNAFDNEKEWDEATLKYVPRDITLKSITIKNPDCKIDTGAFREGKDLTVYGHTGSTAEAFAKTNGNTFISLDKPQTTKPAATTTTKTTTVTTTATTTVTTVVSTIIGPDKECLFIAVKDPATATEAGSDRLLDVDNVAYIDQQTADEKGKVTFSFIPDAVKDLAYLFISEINYSKINKTVVNGTDVQTTWYPATDPSVTVYGDSNNDGVVELADAILIMQQMANPDKYALNGSSQYCITEQGMINGDVYEPGSGLTGNDALTIQEYLLGKRDNLVRY